jgi:CheY-like chemotaxis protein
MHISPVKLWRIQSIHDERYHAAADDLVRMEPPMQECPTVLVIEDDACLAEVLQLTLELEGYQVRRAACGETALELVQIARPDLVTLDLRSPDLDDHYLLEMLRQDAEAAGPSLPVIVISGGHYRASSTDGVVTVLPKPFAVDELQQVVHTVLATNRWMAPLVAGGPA